MIEVAVADGTIEAVDPAKTEVGVQTSGWSATRQGPRLDRRVDAVVSGTTSALAFDDASVSIQAAGEDGWRLFDERTGPDTWSADPTVIQVAAPILTYVATDSAGSLTQDPAAGTVRLQFDRPAPVTIGFRSQLDAPRTRLTVPRSLAGAATAISHLSAAIRTETPDKSYPTKRGHPPLIAFGDRTQIPAAVRQHAMQSSIRVVVPRAIEPLIVAAPLAYYLSATVDLAETDAVWLAAPALDTPLALGSGADLERGVAELLHRVFYLDCLVRTAGPYGVPLREARLLDDIGLDASDVYDRPGDERLARYVDVDVSSIADRLPSWHLSAVLEPSLDVLGVVPHLLDRLSVFERPRPVAVDKGTLLADSVKRSFVAGTTQRGVGPDWRYVRNATRLAARQGWLAAGRPVDAFRATPAAFANRTRYLDRTGGPRRVLVVINDADMLAERTAVERIYRERATELAIEVTVDESVSRRALARHLESPVDFLHFIGHCDPVGLRCSDGPLDVSELDRTAVRTFFINACGSFDQGLALVERGSLAGAVTIHPVLNAVATRVGQTFARLVMHGFSVAHALELAGRQSVTNRFYAVVGDGTHRLSQGEDVFPTDLRAERVSPDAVRVRFNFPPDGVVGGLAKPTLPAAEEYVLRGCPYETELGTAAFARFLQGVSVPVVFDGACRWSTELAAELAPPPVSSQSNEDGD